MNDTYDEALANLPATPEVRAAAADLMDTLAYQPGSFEDFSRILNALRLQIKSGCADRAAELITCLDGLADAAAEREAVRS